MSKRKYNWEMIDTKYAIGDMSLHELADAEGIPYYTLAAHARKAKYADMRADYKQLVLSKVKENMSERDVDAIGDLKTATEKIIMVIDAHIADDATLHNYVTGQTETRLNKLDTKALRNLAGALRDVACVLKILNPDPESGGDQDAVVIIPGREEE